MNYDPDLWRFREYDQQVNPLPGSRVALTGSVPAWHCECYHWNGITVSSCNNCSLPPSAEWQGRIRAHSSWVHMKTRCLNPRDDRYESYGGRGITVCERWLHSFENFFADMGARPNGTTLERKNNDGSYEPSNCKWATAFEQQSNTRRTVILEFQGERRTMSQWARHLDIKISTLMLRLRRGWSVERALSEVVIKRQKRIKPNPAESEEPKVEVPDLEEAERLKAARRRVA